MKRPRSELEFATFLSYCPRGDTDAMRKAKNFVLLLKENRVVRGTVETASERVARRLSERDDVGDVTAFLDSGTVLVPVPRSGLRKRDDDLWPAAEIAEGLRARGFGREVLRCLHRRRAVPKAATAPPKDRPKARTHFESLDLLEPLSLPAKVTLIDDVITRGAQFFGAAWRIWAARPDLDVRAFAVMRAESDVEKFKGLDDPRTGQIRLQGGGDCRRRP